VSFSSSSSSSSRDDDFTNILFFGFFFSFREISVTLRHFFPSIDPQTIKMNAATLSASRVIAPTKTTAFSNRYVPSFLSYQSSSHSSRFLFLFSFVLILLALVCESNNFG